MGEDEVLTQRQAWSTYDRWLEDPRVAVLEEPSGEEKMFRDISHQERAAARDWADSYLLAFAEASDLSLVTFDRGLWERNRSVLLLA